MENSTKNPNDVSPHSNVNARLSSKKPKVKKAQTEIPSDPKDLNESSELHILQEQKRIKQIAQINYFCGVDASNKTTKYKAKPVGDQAQKETQKPLTRFRMIERQGSSKS